MIIEKLVIVDKVKNNVKSYSKRYSNTAENFKKVLNDKYLLVGFRNTGIILFISIFFNVMFGTITAFVIERFQLRGKKIVISMFFVGMLIPTFVTEIARFQVIQKLQFYNTIWAPIVIYIASDLMQLYILCECTTGILADLSSRNYYNHDSNDCYLCFFSKIHFSRCSGRGCKRIDQFTWRYSDESRY